MVTSLMKLGNGEPFTEQVLVHIYHVAENSYFESRSQELTDEEAKAAPVFTSEIFINSRVLVYFSESFFRS